MVYLFSQWYTRKEQGIRLAIVTSAASLSACLAGLLGFAVKEIPETSQFSHWQWLFLVEGVPTILLGLGTYFVLPGTPDNTSWLSVEDRLLIKMRNEMSSLEKEKEAQAFRWREVGSTLLDPMTILYMGIGLGYSIPNLSMSLMMPLIINGLGYSTSLSMVLSIFPHMFAAFLAIPIARHSDRKMCRGWYIFFGLCFSGISFLILLIPDLPSSAAYVALALIPIGIAPCVPINYAWANNNSKTKTISATRSALIVLFSNVSGLFTSLLYWTGDAPRFIISHLVNIGTIILALLMVLSLQLIIYKKNRSLEVKMFM